MRYMSLFLLLFFAPVTAPAYTVYRTDGGTPIRWYKDTVVMYGDMNGTADVAGNAEWQAVNASIETWDKEACKQPRIVFSGLKKDGQSGYWPDKNNYNLIKWVNDKKEWEDKYTGGDTVIAFTTITFDLKSGEIFDADTELNDWAFDFTVDPSRSKYDVQNTVTHELGHVLGMDHSKNAHATMFYSANKGDINKRTLAQDDTNGLCYLYGTDWMNTEPEKTESSEYTKDGSAGGCTQTKGSQSPYAVIVLVFWLVFFVKLRSRKER